MKAFLKRRLSLFPKLRRRLSSVKWSLLLITTAMFFLSASQQSCPGLSISFGGSPGPAVLGPQPSQPVLPPPGGSAVAGGSPPMAGGSPPPVAGGSPPPVAGGSPPPVAAGSPPPAAGGSPPPAPPAGGGGGKTMAVAIKRGSPTATDPSGFIFVPATLTVPKGTTVVWTNMTAVNHTVTDNGGSFDSGDFGANKTYMHTFTTAGTINYICQDHPGQVGSIKVT